MSEWQDSGGYADNTTLPLGRCAHFRGKPVGFPDDPHLLVPRVIRECFIDYSNLVDILPKYPVDILPKEAQSTTESQTNTMPGFIKMTSRFKWPKKNKHEPPVESLEEAERFFVYNARSTNGVAQSQSNLFGQDHAIFNPKHGLIEDPPSLNPFKFRPNKLKKKRASRSRANLLSRENVLLAERQASVVPQYDDEFGDWAGQDILDRNGSDDRLIDALCQHEESASPSWSNRVGPGSSLEHLELLHRAGERETMLNVQSNPDARARLDPRSSFEQLEAAREGRRKRSIDARLRRYNLDDKAWSVGSLRAEDRHSAASAVREVVASTAAWREREADVGRSGRQRDEQAGESNPRKLTSAAPCRISGIDIASSRLSNSNPRPLSLYLNSGPSLDKLETLGRSAEIRRRPSLFTASDRALLRDYGLLGPSHQENAKRETTGARVANLPEAWLDSASSGSSDSSARRMPGAWLQIPQSSVLRKPEAGVDIRRKAVPMERLSRTGAPEETEFKGLGLEAVSWAKSLRFELEGKSALGPPGCNRGGVPRTWGEGKGKGKATEWNLGENLWREARDSMFPLLDDLEKDSGGADKSGRDVDFVSSLGDSNINHRRSNTSTLQPQSTSPEHPIALSRSPSTLRQLHSDERLARHLSSEPSPPVAPVNRDCLVCSDALPPLSFPAKPPTQTCSHPSNTCTPCLQTWLQTEITSKPREQPKCPACPAKLSHAETQRAATPASFARYDAQTARSALSELPGFAWCLSPGCGSGQINFPATDPGEAAPAFMECVACKYRQCLRCRVAWHERESCKQYTHRVSGGKAREDEQRTLRMLDSVSKVCPGVGCGCRIQKVSGCDHMRCRHCSHEFCWQCLASHREIKRLGNTAHETGCKFHSRNLDVAWPFNVHAEAARAGAR